MSNSAVILKYLPESTQLELVSTLINQDELEQALEIINVTAIDLFGHEAVLGKLFEKFEHAVSEFFSDFQNDKNNRCDMQELLQEHHELLTLFEYIKTIPKLQDQFYDWTYSKILSFIKERRNALYDELFFSEIVSKFIDLKTSPFALEEGNMSDETELLLLLSLVELHFLSIEEDDSKLQDQKSNELDRLLIPLIGCNIENIALSCSKLIRWRFKCINQACSADSEFDSLTWKLIKRMNNPGATREWKERNILTFLLRILSNANISNGLISFMKTREYWGFLQDSLNHKVHEYRKLGQAVLKLSVQRLSTNTNETFSAELFIWDQREGADIIETWKKFTTLYEIVALDTALNQIQEARTDILSIFDSKFLDPSWGLILFSTGLRASMESVRKYVVSLILEVQNPSIFTSNLRILTETILPTLMQAHYFKAIKNNSHYAQDCPHGERVARFVSRILNNSNGLEQETIKEILLLLIQFGAAFDPARIYVSLGLYRFLESKGNKSITNEHILLFRKLFEFECEELIFETTMQTLYWNCLNYVSDDVTPEVWVDVALFHLRKCLCKLNHLDAGLSTDQKPNSQKITIPFKDNNGRYRSVDTMINLNKINSVILIKLTDFLYELKKDMWFDQVKLEQERDLLLTIEQPSKYSTTEPTGDIQTLPVESFKSINVPGFFENLLIAFTPYKMEIFANIPAEILKQQLGQIGHERLCRLYSGITSYFKQTVDNKLKDEAYGRFFWFVSLTYHSDISSEDVNGVLILAKSNVFDDNCNYSGNVSITSLCRDILSNSDVNVENLLIIYDIASTIWESINEERLVLKESQLHIQLINILFDSHILRYATEQSLTMQKNLLVYGKQVAKLGYARRVFLPAISGNLAVFLNSYSKSFKNKESYIWLADLLISVIVQPQMEQNIFHLKTVVSFIYDEYFGAENTEKLYHLVYNDFEISSKVWAIAGAILSGPVFGQQIRDYLVHSTNLLTSKKRIDAIEENQRLLEWQLLLLSSSRCENRASESMILSVLESIENEASPLVRIYKEWFLGLELAETYNDSEKPNMIEDYLFDLLIDHSKPTLVVSATKILFLALKGASSQDHQRLLSRFICFLIPNAGSNKPLVRHFSNSLMLSFWPHFKDELKDSTLRETVKNLYDNAKKTEVIGQYRSGDANVWDIKKDFTLTGIFGGVIRKTTDHDPLYIGTAEFQQYMAEFPEVRSFVDFGADDSHLWLGKRGTTTDTVDEGVPDCAQSTEISPLQTKSGAWETVLDLNNKKSTDTVKRSSLIVVASLVDKPPNLGGICRLCDVLGAELLTIQDIRAKKHPQFKNVAVTADKWMPMQEVPVNDIASFMKEKKGEGYTLIGLEQTDKSVKLDNDYHFPKKSLILLGTEAHGIPGHLLEELDLCLEIKQFGVIRSMNIQTATAVIVHSYTVQHM
ncbi:tRNA (guanosine(18)-2'-O)-methyltransferase KNAG_0A05550 [Huiozyma naganishii CBS 8797]|uniref:tRNA/rRNA methyltransferase SpoU type domain-containing protein n=1 Tax=Huiozyma naganishii (strain ATCC MYA-139 / BCRC 22969 / CBS 8797 / KCTC 17520 / NBRC 10181 / NCYC 3082 / Yp74L-3) TaxID=1071383 RepID=J7S2K2_HUIN7|nr:hypothetical protein KNAG_0A05550 [Kazachstania naganishii CBS 8797]CCK68219.1 hypothetical protein KNAG_0A05550 [Kazachstania naganishii CBS 8797]